MSLVENLINQISTQGIGSISKPQGFDMQDDTFAKLLDKHLNSVSDNSNSNLVGNMGAPAGLFIEPFEGIDFAETAQDQMEIIGENKISREEYINQPIEFKDINLGDHFSNLLKTNLGENSDFLNFARKQASLFYNQHSKNLIMDTKEFVQDILNS